MAASTSVELKALQTRRDTVGAEVELLLEEKKRLDSRYNEKKRELDNINAHIQRLQESSAEPIISEHALLRWVERVMGIDLDDIRQQMLSARTKNVINTLHTCKVPIENGARLVVKNRTVVSVLPPHDDTQ